MFSPLVESVIEQYDYPVLTEASLEEFLESNGEAVLFFTENAQKFPETNDVIMILPELVTAFGGRFSVAVIAMDDQRKLQKRYGFSEWPTLVFLRKGQYLGAISRVQDWVDYIEGINRILSSEPIKPPMVTIPVSTAGGCA